MSCFLLGTVTIILLSSLIWLEDCSGSLICRIALFALFVSPDANDNFRYLISSGTDTFRSRGFISIFSGFPENRLEIEPALDRPRDFISTSDVSMLAYLLVSAANALASVSCLFKIFLMDLSCSL